MSLFLVFSLCGCEEAGYPQPTEEFYVNDFADVMTEEEEQTCLSKAVALNNATTAQVVIATVEDLGGEEPYEYATALGREWGIGDEEKDNGILILLSRDDREIFIAVGYGLEGALNDGFLKAKNNEKMNFYIMWANHNVQKNYWNCHRYARIRCTGRVICGNLVVNL